MSNYVLELISAEYATDVLEPCGKRVHIKLGAVPYIAPELSVETPPDPLHQLRDLDGSSPQSSGQLAKFLDRKEYIKSLPNLCNEDLVWLVEYLDRVSFRIAYSLSLPTTIVGPRRYLRSCESRLPEAPARTRKDMRRSRGAADIVHALALLSARGPATSFW